MDSAAIGRSRESAINTASDSARRTAVQLAAIGLESGIHGLLTADQTEPEELWGSHAEDHSRTLCIDTGR